MVILKGSYEELMSKSFYEGTSYTEDYVHIFLTDESDVPDAVSKLRMVYRNLMKMDYDNSRTRRQNIISGAAEVKEIDPVKLFGEFFETQNNIPLSEEQAAFAENIIKEAWGDIK